MGIAAAAGRVVTCRPRRPVWPSTSSRSVPPSLSSSSPSPLAIHEPLYEDYESLSTHFAAKRTKTKKVVEPADGDGGAPAKGALSIDRERKQTLGIVMKLFKKRIAEAKGDPTAAVVRALGNEADDFAVAKAAAQVYLKFVELRQELIAAAGDVGATHINDNTSADTLLTYAQDHARDAASASSDLTAAAKAYVELVNPQATPRQKLIATAGVACATQMDDDTSADTLLTYAQSMDRGDAASASSDLNAMPPPLSFNELQRLVTAAPPNAEAAMLRRWKGDKAALHEIERFAFALGTCDRFDAKLHVALMRRNWVPHVAYARDRLEILAKAADEVRWVRQEDSIDRTHETQSDGPPVQRARTRR